MDQQENQSLTFPKELGQSNSQRIVTERKTYKYVTINQFCDVLEDFIQRNKDKDPSLDKTNIFYINYLADELNEDKFDDKKINIKIHYVYITKSLYLDITELQKLFNCMFLYLKVPKISKTHNMYYKEILKSMKYIESDQYNVRIKNPNTNKYEEIFDAFFHLYIKISRKSSSFIKDGKELKYHSIINNTKNLYLNYEECNKIHNNIYNNKDYKNHDEIIKNYTL